MRILVVGAGATGGYFGARLAMAGRDVTFLVRPRRAAALQERGLRIIDLGGEEHVITPKLVTADELDSTYDLVLLSVKSTALDAAIKDMAPAIGQDTVIVPFLNGLAHIDELGDRFGRRAALGAVVMVATTLNEVGDVVRLGPLGTIMIGSDTPRLAEVAAALDGAGFELAVHDDIVAQLWAKWVFITTVGALTCLMRGPIGDVVAVPGGAELGPAILAEGAAVAAAAGYPVPAARLTGITAMVTEPGSPHTSSLYRDLASGASTEVEHLFGDLTARARSLAVPTPLLDLATMHLRVHQYRVEHG